MKRNGCELLTKALGTNSPVLEAYRSLRTAIQFAEVNAPVRVIEVTSTALGEGKSTVAANLASVMALTGARCILVDADLRRPVQAKALGFNGKAGLTNVLVGTTDLNGALLETEVKGLQLLPSGAKPPNPSELLGSEAMASLLHELRTKADMVIIDTPPLLPVTDAVLLAPKVDGTILVVQAGRTQREAVLRAKQLLESVHGRILGVVLNGVDPWSGYRRYYHYRD